MNPFAKVLLHFICSGVIGVGAFGLGMFATCKLPQWGKPIAVLTALVGVVMLVYAAGGILRWFEPCYSWGR